MHIYLILCECFGVIVVSKTEFSFRCSKIFRAFSARRYFNMYIHITFLNICDSKDNFP